jgi:hypothetical protein
MEWTRPLAVVSTTDKPRKDDLVGSLVVITLRAYDPAFPTEYGTNAMAEFDLVVVEGRHAGYREAGRREFGTLARQVGTALQPGQTALGRYASGNGSGGRSWFGVTWADDPADFKAAEAAMATPF